MAEIFFTADTHFNHANIIKFSRRPFKNVEEMNESIIENWNKVVSENDIVYHLGDFSFGFQGKFLKRLNGKVHLILGSHDKMPKSESMKFASVQKYKEIKYNEIPIVLFHNPIDIWEKSHYDSIHLHGHTHGLYQAEGKIYDVGVDNNNFTPIHIIDILKIMVDKPHNKNALTWIKKKESL